MKHCDRRYTVMPADPLLPDISYTTCTQHAGMVWKSGSPQYSVPSQTRVLTWPWWPTDAASPQSFTSFFFLRPCTSESLNQKAQPSPLTVKPPHPYNILTTGTTCELLAASLVCRIATAERSFIILSQSDQHRNSIALTTKRRTSTLSPRLSQRMIRVEAVFGGRCVS